MAHALIGVQDVAQVGQLEGGDLPHLVLEVVTQAEDCLRTLDPHPYMGSAESKPRHSQIVNAERLRSPQVARPHTSYNSQMKNLLLVLLIGLLLFLAYRLYQIFFMGG